VGQVNHHSEGVIVHPGATGILMFERVHHSYIVVMAAAAQGLLVSWDYPLSASGLATLTLRAHNPTNRVITVIPMVKDAQPEPAASRASARRRA